MKDFFADRRFAKMAERDFVEGQHRNDDVEPRWFTTAYFHRPEGLRDGDRRDGAWLDELIAVEGVAHWLGDLDDISMTRAAAPISCTGSNVWKTEASLLGASGHLLAVARGPGEAT